MSAEVLRRAAVLMRDRAEDVRSWSRRNPDSTGPSFAWFSPMFIAEAFSKEAFGPSDDPALREGWALDGEHIAPWTPAVALAVADWLDGVALFLEAKDDEEYFDLDGDPIAPEDTHAIGSALAVARAYLGESA